MKVIKEVEDRIQYRKIEFVSQDEKKKIVIEMKKDGWEDLDPNSKSLIVILKKYIESEAI